MSAEKFADIITKDTKSNKLINIIKEFDEETYNHSINVGYFTYEFSNYLDLPNKEDYAIAGLLHDIGKTKIDLGVLKKKDRLEPDEFNIIKQHTIKGYEILRDNNYENHICLTALEHHEPNYPYHSLETHFLPKLVGVIDVFCAMFENRSYRDKKINIEDFKEVMDKEVFPKKDRLFKDISAIYNSFFFQ